MDEIKSIEMAREHLKALLVLLETKNNSLCQEEIKDCIETTKNKDIIYFHTFYIDYKGIKPDFRILKRRARVQDKLKGKEDKSRVKGYKTLISNLESLKIETYRSSSIFTKKGLLRWVSLAGHF
jgi:hypothetical protein